MSQLALPLAWPAPGGEESFLVSPSNAAAVRHLQGSDAWPVPVTILAGPPQSGRSLLGRVFAGREGGRVIDDADRADEGELFAAWNRAQGDGRSLLLIAAAPPPIWSPRLPDLRSRLGATPVVTMGAPDDALLERLLPRLLERRGLAATPELVGYLVARLPRTHAALHEAVARLDTAALAQRRPLTVPLAREALGLGVDA